MMDGVAPSDGVAADVDSGMISPRIEAFLRSVIFVHEHNGMGGHRVALNRFSDMLSHELPLMSQSVGVPSSDSSSFGGGDFEFMRSALDDIFPFNQHAMTSEERGPTFVSLDSDEVILKFWENLGRIHEHSAQSNHVRGTSYIDKLRSMLDSWRWMGGEHRVEQIDPPAAHPLTRSTRGSFLLDKENELGGLEDEDGSSHHDERWDRHLNWATEDNPDGVRIVHDAMDQGYCGSCWAVSATGTIEASIARNMAYIAYEDAFSSRKARKHSNRRRFAVDVAQRIERKSIDTADLSVQELIDCDTRYDQGCSGGNPLLAFYFLHRFGITSARNYPYTGTMDTCNYRKVDEPVATVKSWGILTADHENNIEKVLRYIGPVAVGLIGGDPAFLSYETGVFLSSKGGQCDTGKADHAMLIVGYGEEVSRGAVLKYWIARNSWGSGWGENGYVRVARLGGAKGHHGVCGIAQSPSIALGGMFTRDVEIERFGNYQNTGFLHDGSKPDRSMMARASYQIQSAMHRIRVRLGFSQRSIMMSAMIGDEKDDLAIAMPCAMMIGMLLACLVFAHTVRKRRRKCVRSATVVEVQQSNDEESVSTFMGVHNGISGLVRFGMNSNDSSERIRLLENNTGTKYTS
ncbi:hypothetical protein ACHAW5_005650 [Stephanodiscus triporus]|uniref:Peptidase C1A papain C-terminal domain-containing protein n=1 Tax=Stephanodiscus triporus TaxID=2934178 RepID=A0ABD3PAI3_9STRA